MAREIERRLERLEAAAMSTRPKFVVFDYRDGDVEAQHAAYCAATPENERAELIITLVDPCR